MLFFFFLTLCIFLSLQFKPNATQKRNLRAVVFPKYQNITFLGIQLGLSWLNSPLWLMVSGQVCRGSHPVQLF